MDPNFRHSSTASVAPDTTYFPDLPKPKAKVKPKATRISKNGYPVPEGTRIPEAYHSIRGHVLFSRAWYAEVTKTDAFWLDFKTKVAQTTLNRRLKAKVDVTIDTDIHGRSSARKEKIAMKASQIESAETETIEEDQEDAVEDVREEVDEVVPEGTIEEVKQERATESNTPSSPVHHFIAIPPPTEPEAQKIKTESVTITVKRRLEPSQTEIDHRIQALIGTVTPTPTPALSSEQALSPTFKTESTIKNEEDAEERPRKRTKLVDEEEYRKYQAHQAKQANIRREAKVVKIEDD